MLFRSTTISPVARALRRWRALHQVKQIHAAELFNVSQSTISRWESGMQEIDAEHAQKVLGYVSKSMDSSATSALVRLVRTSSIALHLIDDITHVLIAASPKRLDEFSISPTQAIGRSMWRYASSAVVEAESKLENIGWHELPSPPEVTFDIDRNTSDEVRIADGTCRWSKVLLADGHALRLVETLT
jgi:transcriptional regulator with XRE-family HTH domain